MHLINLIVNYLHRKYGVPLHNFFENWTRGISHLNRSLFFYFNYLVSVTAGGPVSPRGHMKPSSTVDFG